MFCPSYKKTIESTAIDNKIELLNNSDLLKKCCAIQKRFRLKFKQGTKNRWKFNKIKFK